MSKFVVYEKVAEYVYANFVDKNTASGGMNTTVNLGSGLIAGFAAALVPRSTRPRPFPVRAPPAV
jgi:solute carrier family 25 phosphate transporter 3